ncbi:uncharacterized protein C1orf131 homolog isoform X2 [Heptranchias perlo]|uniref:uncharacterized protein C1orf131 homolog isoform X2 n=1 Tax=Heptranchias perlo TaxID=212740 RepID=UPI0035595BAE
MTSEPVALTVRERPGVGLLIVVWSLVMDEGGPGEGERSLLLDNILCQLYEYGEAAVGGKKAKGKKAKPKASKGKQKETEEGILCSETQPVPCSSSVPRTSDLLTKKAANSSHGTPKCLVKLRAELLDSVSDCAVPAKAEGEKGTDNGMVAVSGKSPVEVVTFTGSHKRNKLPPITDEDSKVEETGEQNKTEQNVFNLEKARLEVHRFGITGYRKEQQRMFEQERAVMLGARPPKRDYVNYKNYQEMMRNKVTAKHVKMNSKSALSRKKKEEERRHKKTEIVPTGQVGRFKNGALILSDSDIKRIKTKSKSKHV